MRNSAIHGYEPLTFFGVREMHTHTHTCTYYKTACLLVRLDTEARDFLDLHLSTFVHLLTMVMKLNLSVPHFSQL